jgi:hypothetical protein
MTPNDAAALRRLAEDAKQRADTAQRGRYEITAHADVKMLAKGLLDTLDANAELQRRAEAAEAECDKLLAHVRRLEGEVEHLTSFLPDQNQLRPADLRGKSSI